MYALGDRVRTVLLRPEAGASLLDALGAACEANRVNAGWARALGVIRGARIRLGPDDIVSVPGDCVLAGLDASVAQSEGRPSLRASCVVTTRGIAGFDTIAGELLEAKVIDVEAFVLAADGIEAERTRGGTGSLALRDARGGGARPSDLGDRSTQERPVESSRTGGGSLPGGGRGAGEGAPRSAAPVAARAPAPEVSARPERAVLPPATLARPEAVLRGEGSAAAASPGPARPAQPQPQASLADWGRVAAASQRVQDDSDEDDGEIDVEALQRGDTLLHPTLGKCEVIAQVGDEAVTVRLSGGAARKLVLQVFRIHPTGADRVFELRRKG